MADAAAETAPKPISYAKIVDPAKEDAPKNQTNTAVANNSKAAEKVEKAEKMEKAADKNDNDGGDDDEGFQQVTNKKVEKQKEKDL